MEYLYSTPKLRLSVVTPTYCRPQEVRELLENLSRQTLLPDEVILVDGAPDEERSTARVVTALRESLPFRCEYFKSARGTARQRNAGIEKARGEFVAFIDDDVRLKPDFFKTILAEFSKDQHQDVGGIVGYRTNCHFHAQDRQRWRWYRRLKLLRTYEPGRYDYASGYPINNNMQPPFRGVREVDFITTACAVWRRQVFDAGLRFDDFFCDYGVLEDAHFALRAKRAWRLLQCGDAHCVELSSPNGRVDRKKIGYKSVVNYYYVFQSIVQPLTWQHKVRFWRYQAFELVRVSASAVRRRRYADIQEVQGRLTGFITCLRGDIRHASNAPKKVELRHS